MTALVWFQRDLRVADHPALLAAANSGMPVIPVYIHAPADEGAWPPGAAARWWLHHSLAALERQLRSLGSRLVLRHANSYAELIALVKSTRARAVFWNRRYEPEAHRRELALENQLEAMGVTPHAFDGSLLYEPWTVRTKNGGPYQVFGAFKRNTRTLPEPREPLRAPRRLTSPSRWPHSAPLATLDLLPRIHWTAGLEKAWRPGSAAASRDFNRFLKRALDDYDEGRNLPGRAGTSRLSARLHFGELSPAQVWHRVRAAYHARGRDASWRDSQFLTEILWRDFAHHVLFHFPHTDRAPLRAQFARFPWRRSASRLAAWQRGLTGYPIVDAGMRELWATGWMHNRVRMIVASFLVKDLLIDWRAGARWFWDALVDADLANNTLGWQWSAGCGADAAPYFRIFNPTTQGKKFDPRGVYVRRWVPEIRRLPDGCIHEPWTASERALRAARIELGRTYPEPIVDHAHSRLAALRALRAIGKKRAATVVRETE